MRVVPPMEMVAYMESVGALEDRVRPAGAADLAHKRMTVAVGRPATVAVRVADAAPSLLTRMPAWYRRLAGCLQTTWPRWMRAIESALAALLLMLLAVSPAIAQETPEKLKPAGASRKPVAAVTTLKTESSNLSLPLFSVEREVHRLELERALRPPVVVVIQEPDFRLLALTAVSWVSLSALLLVMFMKTRMGMQSRAVLVRSVARLRQILLLRKTAAPASASVAPKDAKPQDDEPPAQLASYRSTQSGADSSDALVDCWLDALEDSLDARGGAPFDSGRWRSDVRSHRGNVRTENQDFALGFTIHGLDVAIVADGCGGVPFGYQASRIGACAAAKSLVRRLAVGDKSECLEDAVRRAFTYASTKLAMAALHYGKPDSRADLLQTTLMICVASAARVTFGYIGDGGAVLIRQRDGTELRVLEPMKAEGMQNILAAVLGPQLLGEPHVHTIERETGDLLVMGTDGVWDYTPPSFAKEIVRQVVRRQGQVGEALDDVLQSLADVQDEIGHVCSDNLTIAVIAPDRCAPRFGVGYWSRAATAPIQFGQPGDPTPEVMSC